jgi:hypothetical protein
MTAIRPEKPFIVDPASPPSSRAKASMLRLSTICAADWTPAW